MDVCVSVCYLLNILKEIVIPQFYVHHRYRIAIREEQGKKSHFNYTLLLSKDKIVASPRPKNLVCPTIDT